MVSGMTGGRLNPSRVEAEIGISFEERVGQHLTGAVGEELAVRPMPLPHRVAFDMDLREEHRSLWSLYPIFSASHILMSD